MASAEASSGTNSQGKEASSGTDEINIHKILSILSSKNICIGLGIAGIASYAGYKYGLLQRPLILFREEKIEVSMAGILSVRIERLDPVLPKLAEPAEPKEKDYTVQMIPTYPNLPHYGFFRIYGTKKPYTKWSNSIWTQFDSEYGTKKEPDTKL